MKNHYTTRNWKGVVTGKGSSFCLTHIQMVLSSDDEGICVLCDYGVSPLYRRT